MTRTIKTIETDRNTTIEIDEIDDGLHFSYEMARNSYTIVERDEYGNPIGSCMYAETIADAKYHASQMAY